MVEFARIHVREAVKSIIKSENIQSSEEDIEKLTEESINNNYPLDNIK